MITLIGLRMGMSGLFIYTVDALVVVMCLLPQAGYGIEALKSVALFIL
jgi:hypothetical protein